MKIKVTKCILDDPKIKPLLVQLAIGTTKFRTSWSQLEHGQWNETFEFSPDFHYELFSHLQLDVYTRTFYFEQWLGRVEVKLLQISGLQLISYFEINKNSTKTPINPGKSCGVLSLEIDYTTGDAISIISELLHPKQESESQIDLNTSVPDTPLLYKKKTVVSSPVEDDIKEEIINNESSFTNWLINDEAKVAILNIKDMVFAFQQGWDYLNPLQWVTGYLILERYFRSIPITGSLNIQPIANNLTQLLRIKQIHDYAFSAYGWKGINFFQKGEGLVQAALSSKAHEKAIKAYLIHLSEDEFISYSDGDSNMPAILMVYDKIDNAIVVSIRGTMSLTDSLIDFTCEYSPFYDGFVHIGVLKATKTVKEVIMTDIIHKMALHGASTLILVGHSLGAGIASLLTILLIKDGFKNVCCYAFGCPPILSRNIANRYNKEIQSFIYKYDIVPRLSYGTVSDLVTLAATVMTNTNTTTIFNIQNLDAEFEVIRRCKTKFTMKIPQYYNPKLYIPGLLMYLDDEQLYLVNREISEEIIFASPNVYKDHLPSAYEAVFTKLCESCKEIKEDTKQ
eukprot:NODE_179_length_15798_cov_0.379769.p2 type:complete len:566 gc:universal NODE_179_length_15798_cov_0.379769:5476-7173(+)